MAALYSSICCESPVARINPADGLFHAVKLCEPSHKGLAENSCTVPKAFPEDEFGLVFVIPKESVFFGKGKESR